MAPPWTRRYCPPPPFGDNKLRRAAEKNNNNTNVLTEAASLEAHRVVAALAHDHSAGEGLVVDLDAKRPLPAVESVLLDEVEVVHSSNLSQMEKKKSELNSKWNKAVLAFLSEAAWRRVLIWF